MDVSAHDKRLVLDKGCAGFVQLEPKRHERKISVTIFNVQSLVGKKYNVDRALYGCYEFVEYSPESMSKTVFKSVSLYLVEKIWNLTLLEIIR